MQDEVARLGDTDFGREFRDGVGAGVPADPLAWANRFLELPDGGWAVTGIRFRGRDTARPFVDVVATTAPATPDGLSVVAVIESSDTLGQTQAGPAKAVLLLDSKATTAQREALINVAKKLGGDLTKNVVHVDFADGEFVFTTTQRALPVGVGVNTSAAIGTGPATPDLAAGQ